MTTWLKIETAPFERDLEVAVVEDDGKIYPVIFPCHRVLGGWTKAATGASVAIRPTHWRAWETSKSPPSLFTFRSSSPFDLAQCPLLVQRADCCIMEPSDAPKDKSPPKLSRLQEARRIIEEYANDLREIIKKLRRRLN